MKYSKYCLGILVLLFTLSCGISQKKAQEAELRQEYDRAASMYKSLYRQTNTRKRQLRSFYAWHYAENYRALHQYARALNGYRAALRYAYPDSAVLFRIGEMLQACGKVREAQAFFERYRQTDSTSYPLNRGLSSCLLIERDTTLHQLFQIRRLNQWNSSASDYAPSYSPDGKTLFFTSSRSKDREDLSAITGEANANIFFVKEDNLGRWSARPDTLKGSLNTEDDEGVASYGLGGATLYYSLAERADLLPKTVHIYQAQQEGEGAWNRGSFLNLWQDSTLMSAHPSVSPTGNKLFFVSDVLGGQGSKDIYVVNMEQGKYSYPTNLGKTVNTLGDEVYPYAINDSLLYFSSNGHVGYGGWDIYEARLLPNGSWHVSLLPQPINSSADDYSFAIRPKTDNGSDSIALEGVFASSRGDARGRPHLYSFLLPRLRVVVEGYVLDREGYPIANALVRTVGSRGGQQIVSTKADGSYELSVEGDVRYVMLASADGYLNQYARFRSDSLKDENLYYAIDFYLSSKLNSERLSNIYYAFDDASLLPESQGALEDLLQILEDNPDVRIQLSAHADRKGDKAYNQALSEQRAKSVVAWLIEHGIDSARLEAKGFGEEEAYVVSPRVAEQYPFLKEGQSLDPQFISGLSLEQQAVCDSLNRRSEFKVLP